MHKAPYPVKVLAEGDQEGLWVTSYADLISAVLAVLVLFVSFSKIDIEKYDAVTRLMRKDEKIVSLREIQSQLIEAAKVNDIDKHIGFEMDRNGLKVSYESAALFQSGSYELDESRLAPFEPIQRIIAEVGQQREIDIEGHTDDLPMKNGESNWKLSALRALAMQEHLKKFGLPEQGLRLIAFSNTSPKTTIEGLVGSDLDNARQQNRRVTIRISKPKL